MIALIPAFICMVFFAALLWAVQNERVFGPKQRCQSSNVTNWVTRSANPFFYWMACGFLFLLSGLAGVGAIAILMKTVAPGKSPAAFVVVLLLVLFSAVVAAIPRKADLSPEIHRHLERNLQTLKPGKVLMGMGVAGILAFAVFEGSGALKALFTFVLVLGMFFLF